MLTFIKKKVKRETNEGAEKDIRDLTTVQQNFQII